VIEISPNTERSETSRRRLASRPGLYLLGGVIFAGALLCLRSMNRPDEPVYQGHPLGYWFHELPVTIVQPGRILTCQSMATKGRLYGTNRVQPSECLAAIEKTGADGVPFLMWKLRRPKLPWSNWICDLAMRAGMAQAPFADPEIERGQATTALLALPSLPERARRQLRELSKRKDDVGVSADYILRAQTEMELRDIVSSYR
jgi:hypothetical protein